MINLRWARPDERSPVQQYLFEKMGKIPFDKWANILDCRWNKKNDQYGVVVEENGELAGFLGIVFADRDIDDQSHRTGNITSWYIAKHLRRGGLGQDMLELITQDENVTYVATSANFRSGALLKKIGWQVMEEQRLFWQRLPTPTRPTQELITGQKHVLYYAFEQGDLSSNASQIIRAHEGLNITHHLLTQDMKPPLFFCTYEKRKGPESVQSFEILYAENRQGIGQNIQTIADLLLPNDQAVLSSDSRFVEGGVAHSKIVDLEVPRFFKPTKNLSASQISFIFSEVLLLDLKVY